MEAKGLSQTRWFLGLSVGIVGLGLLVGPSMGTNGGVSYDMLRIGAIVMACFTWTVGSMMTRYAKTPVDPFTGSAIQMLGVAYGWSFAVRCLENGVPPIGTRLRRDRSWHGSIWLWPDR